MHMEPRLLSYSHFKLWKEQVIFGVFAYFLTVLWKACYYSAISVLSFILHFKMLDNMLNAKPYLRKLKLNPDAVSSHDNDIFFLKFVNDIFKKWSSKRTSEKKEKTEVRCLCLGVVNFLLSQ